MDGEAKLVLWTVVVVAVVAVLVVRVWPYRRFREIVVQRRIAAPPQRIWDAYRCDPDDPVSAGFHDTIERSYVVSEDPKIVDLVVHSGDRGGPQETVVRSETLAEEPPFHMASRCLSVNDKPSPFGERNCEEFTQREDGGEMVVTISWRGELATLGQHWGMRRFMTKTIDRLKSYCETGEGSMMPKSTRSPWKSLGLTVLAFGSFSFLFGWIAAIILSVAIAIHEFGHWLAMRMTGQPNPRIMLVPFFGGVAVPNKPYKSQFDDAFVSLMGAGISVVPCLALLGAAFLVGDPVYSEAPKFGKFSGSGIAVDRLLYLLAALVGLMNAIQLIPVLPLDGGHVVRSVVQIHQHPPRPADPVRADRCRHGRLRRARRFCPGGDPGPWGDAGLVSRRRKADGPPDGWCGHRGDQCRLRRGLLRPCRRRGHHHAGVGDQPLTDMT